MPNKQSDIAGGFAAGFLTRKQFLKTLVAAAVCGPGASSFPGRVQAARADPVAPESGAKDRSAAVPAYLKGYEDAYRKDPHAAAMEWHRNAKWGLFAH